MLTLFLELNETQLYHVVFCLSVLYLLWKYPICYYFSVLNKYPAPPTTSWLRGSTSDLMDNKSWEKGNFPNPIVPWIQKYGEVFRFRGFGFSHNLFVVDPDAVKYILVTNGSNYRRLPLFQRSTIQVTGKAGLFGTEGSAHLKQRKVLNPHFNHAHVKEFSEIFEHHVDLLIKHFDQAIADGNNEVALNQKFTELTLDIIGMSAFGYKFDSLNSSENKAKQAYEIIRRKRSPLMIWAMGSIPGFRHLPTEYLTSRKRALKTINETVDDIIYSKIHHKPSNLIKKDLLDLMLDNVLKESDVNKQNTLIEEAKSHVLTFLIAGHETTSTTFSWFFALLSQHPDKQRKIREESQNILRISGGEKITMKEASQLVYLTACINETMRLYNSALMIFPREAIHSDYVPTVSGEKIQVPAGTSIFISIVGIHRNPKYWTKADEFHPERFIEGSSIYESDAKLRGGRSRTFFFIPFSTGAMNCVGSRFTVAELQIILSNLFARFSFDLSKNADMTPRLKSVAFTPRHLKVNINRID